MGLQLWIAYKLIIFVLLETAACILISIIIVLWIAYKLIIFVLLETAGWEMRLHQV